MMSKRLRGVVWSMLHLWQGHSSLLTLWLFTTRSLNASLLQACKQWPTLVLDSKFPTEEKYPGFLFNILGNEGRWANFYCHSFRSPRA
uniref:Uncharacterized protein n=1 Tax=Arundo donax TaxID=35708 RepID=A0A0A9HAC8_ARUDO